MKILIRPHWIFGAVLLLAGVQGCGEREKQPTALQSEGEMMSAPEPGSQDRLLVRVYSDGHIDADGDVVSMTELRERLRTLAEAGGMVWYYREAAEGEPPAVALEVMDAVADNSLPITLSTKPDFSDYVDSTGRARPRVGGG